jgi:DNA-binding beta-propeller fold protein YncE
LDFIGDLSSASFVDSFSVAGQDSVPTGIAFNIDGTKMFIVGSSGDDVNEYALATGFDVSTASYTQSFSVAAQDADPQGIAFNADGTKMFIVGEIGNNVYEYALSTGFDVSTASYTRLFSVASQDTNPTGVAFNTDGTKMFVVGYQNDNVNEYSLSTGFNVSTASFTDSFSVTAQDTVPIDITFNADGTKMFIVGYNGKDINQYALSTAFDISTASYTLTLSIIAQDNQPHGIAFSADEAKMFMIGAQVDAVYEYSLLGLTLGTGSFASADVGKTIEANSGEFVLTATDGSYVETTAPTSYAQVASGDWSMYGVVYNAADGDLEISGYTDPATAFDVSTAVYSQSLSISAQTGNDPAGIAFNIDGTKMFIVSYAGDAVYEYNLSIGFDISTSIYSQSFSVSAQNGLPVGLAFNSVGTKMFITDYNSSELEEYSLSTGFDLSTASHVRTLSVGAQENSPTGVAFNTDGTKMFVVGISGDDVNEYTLSTGFNISTASFVDSFSVAAQETVPFALAFNSDGTKMFIAGTSSNSVHEYTLSTGFDVSTASFVDSFSVASQDALPRGLCFNSDGTKMFIVGATGDNVYEYSIGSTATPTGYQPVHTTASIDSTYWTDINSMTADQAAGDGNVYYAISTDDRTTWTVIDNTDGERDIVRNNAGTWQYNSNGTYASETWTNATTNTELAALAEAMEGAVGGTSYDIANASYDSVSFSVGAQEGAPSDFAFNTDGTKMFVVGTNGQDVNEYTLSTAYDVSTSSFVDSFSVASQESSPYALAFNNDGSKMYVTGAANDTVYQYTLSTGFDVSTASYSSISFSYSAQEGVARSLSFNPTGTKMYIYGAVSSAIFEYSLSTGFDVSTASYIQSFSVSSAWGHSFNNDGSKLFFSVGTAIKQYSLSTPYNISTLSDDSISFSISSQAIDSGGLVFANAGLKMYVLGRAADTVYQYSVGTTSYTNQMDKTQLDAVTDPNHIALGNDLDLAIVFNMTSGTTVPSSDGVAINYDANVLNKGAVLGTDYDFDAPTQSSVRITALAANNLKVRVV